MDPNKKPFVPLEEALDRAGVGLYTYYVTISMGLVMFSAMLGTQGMSVVVPKAGCELDLSSLEKGVLNSAAYGGMIAAALVFGFLADTYGRRRVMLVCAVGNVILSLLASVAPERLSLIAIWLLNGFLLGGIWSSGLVLVAEFCPQRVRARSILVPMGLSSLAQVFLPCVAWLVFPLDLQVELPFGLIFTPWRLFLAVLAIPTSITILLLYSLPESPKFVLNQGNDDEALWILQRIYAVNNRKRKTDFPVERICLDQSDIVEEKIAADQEAGLCNSSVGRQMTNLFRPPLLFYSIISISVLIFVIGVYNTLFLWYPEQMRVIMHRYDTETEYNVTICDVMSTQFEPTSDSTCALNEDIFLVGMTTAVLQCSLFLLVSLIADRVGKKLLTILIGALSCATFIGHIFANTFFLTIGTLSSTVILLSLLFPLCFSIFIDFFPTSLKSTATSMMSLSGRAAATAGTQIFGTLFENHCTEAYWGIATLLVGSLFLTILMPTKRVS